MIVNKIEDLCSLTSDEYRLTDWELEFVDSVSKQNVTTLSAKQIAKIEMIWRKAFGEQR